MKLIAALLLMLGFAGMGWGQVTAGTTASAISDQLIAATKTNHLDDAGFLLYALQIRGAYELEASGGR